MTDGDGFTLVAARNIPAGAAWTRTGVPLVAGTRYRLIATGWWVDWFVACGPNGYDNRVLRLLRGRRRAPDAPLFRLMGAYDTDEASIFAIGEGLEFEAARPGELTCFANDHAAMRWNNWGAVALWVFRQ